MIISCNECDSSFSVDDGVIKESGTKVRCSKCDSVFVAYPQPPEDELAMDSEEQLLSSDEDLGLVDIESSVKDFLGGLEDLELDLETDMRAGEELNEAELEDLELDLVTDMQAGEELDEVGLEIEGDEELEVGDLDLEEDIPALEVESSADSEDQNSGLDLDPEAEAQTSVDAPEPGDKAEAIDELDLSDLEEIMESDHDGVAQALTEDTAEDLELN